MDNTIVKIFIAHLGEKTLHIPQQLIHITLEKIDHSIAMRKLRKEERAAFNTNNKQIREKTIDDAIHKTEKHINDLFEASPMSSEELHEQKEQNNLIAQLTKHGYCEWLKQKDIAVV